MAIETIKKRDGRIVPFDSQKITDAIIKAFTATYRQDSDETAAELTDKVVAILEVENCETPEVEHIQDIVERVLMDNGYISTAKAYILYRSERNRVRQMNT
ncbi:MAG: anaerobic ribonucleoside triphosphate reductase, partial [Oscillospiraceae bacterium]|nr:anaerobic ribonucleoside triphosphate reductase [Oscillospiraceae bacterium]